MRCFLLYIDDYLSSQAIARMDAHEERGYVRLLLRCGTEPDGGLPSNEKELALTSLLGGQWFQPTKDEEKRFSDTESSGQKLLGCFFCVEDGAPIHAVTREAIEIDSRIDLNGCIAGRLYNERFLREFQYQKQVSEKRSVVGKAGAAAKRKKRTEGQVTEVIAPSEVVIENTQITESKQLLESDELLLENLKQTDKQTGKQNTTNDVWVSVSGNKNLQISDLLNGKTEIDLANPIQTNNLSHDLFLPELMRAATVAGIGYSPAEIRTIRNTFWPRWDFAKRRKVVQGILDRDVNGEYQTLPPLLKNYLGEEHWDRPLRPRERRNVTEIPAAAHQIDRFGKPPQSVTYPKTTVTAEQLAAMRALREVS